MYWVVKSKLVFVKADFFFPGFKVNLTVHVTIISFVGISPIDGATARG